MCDGGGVGWIKGNISQHTGGVEFDLVATAGT